MGVTHQELASMCHRALEDRETFWTEVADKLVWTKMWTKVVDDSQSPFTKWFVGGELNLSYNCLDRHVKDGYGDKVAIIFDSPVSKTVKKYTYSEILDQVSRLACFLTKLGVTKGDVVMIYMPIIPEGAFSMLACARIGAIHVCVPNGITAVHLIPRIDHAKPKVIIMSSHGYHFDGWMNYKTEMDLAYNQCKNKPKKIIVLHRQYIKDRVSMSSPRDIDFEEAVISSEPVSSVPMEANMPLFMIFTSGTTGHPKAIVHSVGGFSVRLQCDTPIVLGKGQDDNVTFSTTYLGWILSHVLVIYGPLLTRITSIFFEGDPLLTDDVRALYNILETHKVTTTFIRPGILKAVKGKDPQDQVSSEFNFHSLRHIYVGGERTDANTMTWVAKTFQAHVWSFWGQTEMAFVLAGAADITEERNSPNVWEFAVPFPGWDLCIKKSDGTEAKSNDPGRVLVRLPLPPGAMLTLFEDEVLCKKVYFTEYPDFFDTKDEGCFNENGYVRIDSRTDDIMKIGSIYIASPAIEEVIQKHKSVVECVVVSITDLVWKEQPIALYTKVSGCVQDPKEIEGNIIDMVTEKFGKLLRFKGAVLVEALPKTSNGKLHRSACKAIVRKRPLQGIGGVENRHVLEDIRRRLDAENYSTNELLD